MSDLTAGRTVGKYRILGRLGRGGMADVYQAYQPGLDRCVAVKVMQSRLAEAEDFLSRFEREAALVARMRHSNIVQVFDFDVEDDLYYMVMELVTGPTLKAELRERAGAGQPFTLTETAHLFRRLAGAIDYAHAQGMVHHDLKPANIMFMAGGAVVLTDFGLARIVGNSHHTVTGTVYGTPAYMSPEQVQGERGDPRSDIYALGTILYEVVTGRVPFEADTPFALMMQHVNDSPPPPTGLNPDLAKSVEEVILKALSKKPPDRYQTAGDMVTALQQAVGITASQVLAAPQTITLASGPQIVDVSEMPELERGLSPASARRRLEAGPAPDDRRSFISREYELAQMDGAKILVGRQREQAKLNRALEGMKKGKGQLVLLAGEAGAGKTHLAEKILAQSGYLLLRGEAREEATPPYGPIVAALRTYLRRVPDGLTSCGPLCKYLALILPELGSVPDGGDQATLVEAIRQAFETIASHEPAVLFLDDLQWADNATLELLLSLAGSLRRLPLLILGAYRSDEIPRGHPVRRLRNELRRARQLQEVAIDSLNQQETATLAAYIFGQALSPALAAAIYDRTQGMPLFVEELAITLGESDCLHQGEAGLELIPGEDIPIPETVRDAVLLRLDGLPEQSRQLLEVAAVVGLHFDLEMVIDLTGSEAGLEALVENKLIVEAEAGRAAFRHALTREAIYKDILWTRRRSLHRQLAGRLELSGTSPELVAEHWLVGKEPKRAREALIVSAQQSCQIHAYRDAAQAGHRALDLWPEGEDESLRLDVLDELGNCAQLCGMLPEAARAWREAAEGRRQAGDKQRLAETQRRLATVYELQGAWEQGLAARQTAAETFTAIGLPAEAATERLAAASYLQYAASHNLALETVTIAAREIDQVDRPDLKARALALEGAIRAKLGQFESGRELVQAGLSLALEHNLTGPAVDAYQKLGTVYENAADYAGAVEAFQTAFNFCETQGAVPAGHACIACLAAIMIHTGEWQQAISLSQELLESPEVSSSNRTIFVLVLGIISALRGEKQHARNQLNSIAAEIQRSPFWTSKLNQAWVLAMVDDLEDKNDLVMKYCRFILEHWQKSDDRHYAVPMLRWALTFFATQGAEAEARACAEAMGRIASENSNPETLAAFAHALGEVALLDGDAKQAAQQFGQALELLHELEYPIQRIETELRAGVAQVAAGEREAGIKHLVNAHRLARKLGARPLAARAAQVLTDLGESIDQYISPRAARQLKHGGLTRRQLDVVRQIALGRTNKEIAEELVLSPRTVDMHVGNILNRLDCRTRAEAVRKAGELGLLEQAHK